MKFIDLSAYIKDGMMVYPAPHIPPVEVVAVARHEDAKRSVQRLSFSTHISTHVDAPLHAIQGAKSIDQIPLETFCGRTALLKIPNRDRKNPIEAADLEIFDDILKRESRIVIDTGWAHDWWGRREYFTEGPHLSRDAARYLAGFNMLLLGIDFPNVDSFDDTKPGTPAPNHVILFKKGMVLVENLLNLHKISARYFRLTVLPLKISGGDGSPCRAIAELEE